MLLCAGGVFLALGMVTLAMMFSGRTMCFSGVLVMLGRLVVFVSCHDKPLWLLAPSAGKLAAFEVVPENAISSNASGDQWMLDTSHS
jgi:hypothetical protein